jgi:membrane protease YdiL (CAAX protease family)
MPKLLRLISIFIFAVAGAYFAGDLSTLIGYRLSAIGVLIPLREVINATIAIVLFLIYAKTQNSFQVKWGGFGGFSAGLETIIMILSVTWGALAYSKAVGNFTVLRDFSVPILATSLAFMLLHALAEQILLQEVLQKRIKEIIGEKAGIMVAGLGFTALQAAQGYLHPLYIFNSLCLGILMAVLYEKHGFLSVVAVHAFWSYLEIVVKNSVVTMDYHYNYLLWRGQDSYGSPLFGALCLLAALMIFGLKKNNLGEPENIL